MEGMRLSGKILGFSNGVLSGWICNVDRLHERLVIEIFGDDFPVVLTRANVWLPESAHVGDGCYGFYQSIPDEKIAQISRLRVKLANVDFWLDGAIFLNKNDRGSQKDSALLGYVANRESLQLYGWAWDPYSPNEAIKLQFFYKNKLLGEVVANQKNPELLDVGMGNGKHGFEFSLPFHFADGQLRQITVLNERGQVLNGSPLQVVTYPKTIDDYLQSLPNSPLDIDLIRLLAKQFKKYQDFLPVSVDFSSYAEWSNCFMREYQYTPAKIEHDFLVLVYGKGDVLATLNSFKEQSYSRFKVLVQSGAQDFTDNRVSYIGEYAWDEEVKSQLKSHVGLLSFVEAGDSLTADALQILNAGFENAEIQIAYSDCFCNDESFDSPQPWFKPDWDFDLFLAQSLLHHAFAVRAGVFAADSLWITEPEAWPWLAIEAVGDKPQAIKHIPRVLYHRFCTNDSTSKEQIADYFLPRVAPSVTVKTKLLNGAVRVLQWTMSEEWPLVSLIVPTRDQKELLQKCISSLQATDYPNLEIIVIDNDTQEAAALKYLDDLRRQNITVVSYPYAFNYSAINNYAVNLAQGSIVGLINNDVEAINRDWLKIMVTHLLRPNVGAVGAKLLWPNGMVQHAGVLLGMDGLAGHIGNDWSENDLGYWGYNQLTRRLNAVTAACLICHKDDYLQLGGLNEQLFSIAFNDVDFCLRLREIGKDIIWTPDAKLWHAESASRGRDDLPEKRARFEKEKSALRRLWGDKLYTDSYYNINLNLNRYSHKGLAFPPRTHKI